MSTTTPAGLSEKREVGRASVILASFTMVSRLLGLVRNQILSHFFGAGFIADAFIAAFTIPNALRRLFGEGALTPAIVSLFTRALREPSDEKAKTKPWQSFISSAFAWLTVCLIILAVLGMLFSPWLVNLYVPEFRNTEGKFELTVQLTRFLFPFIIFIGWSAFFMGILNTFRSFAISAFVPAMLSIAVIIIVPVSLKFIFPETTHGIYFYAGALLVGALFQAALQLPSLKRHNALPFHSFQWGDPRVKELQRLLLPSLFSMGIYQINIIINRTFASGIPGAVSHLFYADLILELPIALVATSLGTAVIPSFSRLIADNKREELAETFQFSLEAIWMLAIPCTLALLALAEPIISTLYFSGKFQLSDVHTTSRVLIFYALGLPFFASLRIFLALFFSAKNTFIPMLAGWVGLAVNLALAWYLSGKMAAAGIALATSLSSLANLIFLLSFVVIRYPEFKWRLIILNFFKILTASIIMGAVLYLAFDLTPPAIWEVNRITPIKILTLGLLMTLGGIVYFLAAFLFKIPHAPELIQRWGRRLLGIVRK